MTYDPLLDRYDQATIPDILTFLARKYHEAMEQRNRDLREQATQRGDDPNTQPMINVGGALDNIATFVNFGIDYLDKNRPATLFHTDQNFGIMLTNQQSLLVAPPVQAPIRGTMQPSNSVGVTGRQTREEIDASWGSQPVTGAHAPRAPWVPTPIEAGGAVPITQHTTQVPKGLVDRTQPGSLRNQTLPQPAQRFDQ